MGLPPDKPHILFVGSSLLTLAEDDEEKFCRRWLSALRNCSDPKLRDISVVVRPHPRTGILWKRSDPPSSETCTSGAARCLFRCSRKIAPSTTTASITPPP